MKNTQISILYKLYAAEAEYDRKLEIILEINNSVNNKLTWLMIHLPYLSWITLPIFKFIVRPITYIRVLRHSIKLAYYDMKINNYYNERMR